MFFGKDKKKKKKKEKVEWPKYRGKVKKPEYDYKSPDEWSTVMETTQGESREDIRGYFTQLAEGIEDMSKAKEDKDREESLRKPPAHNWKNKAK